MTSRAQELLREAEQLSRDEREELALSLLDSLEPDPGYDDAWDEVIQRRIAEIESGSVELVPARELFERIDAAARGERRISRDSS